MLNQCELDASDLNLFTNDESKFYFNSESDDVELLKSKAVQLEQHRSHSENEDSSIVVLRLQYVNQTLDELIAEKK